MTRETDISNFAESIVEFSTQDLRAALFALDAFLPENLRAPKGLICVSVMDEAQLCQIHADFLDDPSATDVITFDGDPEDDFTGEICVSAQRALECAADYGNTPNEELLLYVAHGYLHLAGLDDVNEQVAKRMRAGEEIAMKILKEKLALPVFKFVTKL